MDEDEPQYYWEITERDGTITRIPPDSVEVVQRRWGDGKPIHTRLRSIPASQITSFHITSQRFSTQPLLEAAAQAFKEPIYTKMGEQKFMSYPGAPTKTIQYTGVQGRWVKIVVTMERWQRFYSAIPAYHFLNEINGQAELAFVLATHDIDVNKTPYCTEDEIAILEKK